MRRVPLICLIACAILTFCTLSQSLFAADAFDDFGGGDEETTAEEETPTEAEASDDALDADASMDDTSVEADTEATIEDDIKVDQPGLEMTGESAEQIEAGEDQAASEAGENAAVNEVADAEAERPATQPDAATLEKEADVLEKDAQVLDPTLKTPEAPAPTELDDAAKDAAATEETSRVNSQALEYARVIMLSFNHQARKEAKQGLIAMGTSGIPGAMVLVNDKVQLPRIYGVIILREIGLKGGVKKEGTVPAILFNLLKDHDSKVRWEAAKALRQITNQSFDYHFNAPLSQRNQAIVRWYKYLLSNGLINTQGE